MPWNEAEPDDPMTLEGVFVPADAGAIRRMAVVFAEEYARMGFGRGELLSVFHNPFYSGAHRALLDLGEAEVVQIVEEAVSTVGVRVRNIEADQAPHPCCPPDVASRCHGCG